VPEQTVPAEEVGRAAVDMPFARATMCRSKGHVAEAVNDALQQIEECGRRISAVVQVVGETNRTRLLNKWTLPDTASSIRHSTLKGFRNRPRGR